MNVLDGMNRISFYPNLSWDKDAGEETYSVRTRWSVSESKDCISSAIPECGQHRVVTPGRSCGDQFMDCEQSGYSNAIRRGCHRRRIYSTGCRWCAARAKAMFYNNASVLDQSDHGVETTREKSCKKVTCFII